MKEHSVEKRTISWRELWAMDANCIKFIVGATYDVLPTSQNLSQWVGEDRSCKLCSGVGSLKPSCLVATLSSPRVRYMWRRKEVLKIVGVLRINEFRLTLSHLMTGTVEFLLSERSRKVDIRHVQNSTGKWVRVQDGNCWLMSEDSPQFIVVTVMRLDMTF